MPGVRLLILLTLLTGCVEPPPVPAVVETPEVEPVAEPPPLARRVILITIDTLRADYLGAYGGPARTPVFDRLAEQGWLFEDCSSTAMLTNPSHASILTSLYPRDHGVYDNQSGIQNGMRTIASALQRHGMRTAAVLGFPHLNPEVSNLGQGFDHVIRAQRRERSANDTSQRVLELIDSFDGQNFFIWAHYVEPHAPYEPPFRVGLGAAPPKMRRIPMRRAKRAAPAVQKNNRWFTRAFERYEHVDQLAQRYVREIEAADQGLGRLIEGLEDRSLSDVAIVITSDHGENMGEHKLYFHHGGLYQPTVHVPLLVHAPNSSMGRIQEQVSTIDIAPHHFATCRCPSVGAHAGTQLDSRRPGQSSRTRICLQRTHGRTIGGSAQQRWNSHPPPQRQPAVPHLSI